MTTVPEPKTRKKRGGGVLPMLAQLIDNNDETKKEIEKVVTEARNYEAQRATEDKRLVGILCSAFGSGVKALLRESNQLNDEDKAFLKLRGLI